MWAGPLSRAFQRLSALAADTSTGGEQHRANTERCDRRGIAATLALLTVATIQSLSAMISPGPHQFRTRKDAAKPRRTRSIPHETLTTPDGPERHRRFHLAVNPQTLVGALVPAVVMSGVADSGRKSGHCNIDANDGDRATSRFCALRYDDPN